MKKIAPVQRRNITMPTIEHAVSNYVIALTGSASGWGNLQSSSRRAGVRPGSTA